MIAYFELISSLLEGNAEHILCLNGGGGVIRVNLNDVVATLTLGLQDFKCLGLISGGNDTVGNLTGEELCSGDIANIRECDPVTEGAKAVGAAGTDIRTGEGGLVKPLNILNEACLLKGCGKRKSDGGRGGGNMLEGCSGGNADCLLQLLYKLPGVECVKEVDITGAAVKHGDGKLASVLHKDTGRLLIRVTAIFKLKFFHRLLLIIHSCLLFWFRSRPTRCRCI